MVGRFNIFAFKEGGRGNLPELLIKVLILENLNKSFQNCKTYLGYFYEFKNPSRIRIRIRNPEKKFGSGSRINHSGSATLIF